MGVLYNAGIRVKIALVSKNMIVPIISLCPLPVGCCIARKLPSLIRYAMSILVGRSKANVKNLRLHNGKLLLHKA